MTIRHHIASLLAGFDVERVREERDSVIVPLDALLRNAKVTHGNGDQPGDRLDVDIDAFRALLDFLKTLPIGAVDAARARLAKR